jgi:RimJ/RimL family protein N-acetyltransferase
MHELILSVREIQEQDISSLVQYWKKSDSSFLKNMGVDLNKIPSSEALQEMLSTQLEQSYAEKQSYCIIWLLNGEAIGHCNVNKILFGKEAFMHLHIWNEETRKKGYGTDYIKKTLPFFFNSLQLKVLYCEPYALNPSPNKTLERLGFDFVKKYITIPGSLNFEQEVNLWKLTYKKFRLSI